MDFRTAVQHGRLPVAIGVTAVLLGWFFVNSVRRLEREDLVHNPPGDSGHFYYAAEAMRLGKDIHSYWAAPSGDRYIYPPLIAFLYMPLSLLDIKPALTVLLVINILLLALAASLAAREAAARLTPGADAGTVALIALAAVVLTMDKLKGELQHWQTNVLLLLMFTLALRWLDRRPWAAGAALGFAFNIKYLPLVALPYLLVRRRWVAAGAFVAAAVFFAFLPAVWSGWDHNLAELRTAYAGLLRMVGVSPGPGAAAHIIDITAGFSVSISSALSRVCGTYGRGDLAMPLIAATAMIVLAIVLCLYHIAGIAAFGAGTADARGRALAAVEWAGLITAALVFSPQTNTRHLALLVLVHAVAVALLVSMSPVRHQTAGIIDGSATVRDASLSARAFRVAIALFKFLRRHSRQLALVAALLLLQIGLAFPPGRDSLPYAAMMWFHLGGISWCLLTTYLILLWIGLRQSVSADSGNGPAYPAPGL